MESLQYLVTWCRAHCDGEWEHDLGIRIEILDNPGWSLDVHLVDTELEGIVTARRKDEQDEDVWLFWRSTGRTFEANCGPNDLVRAPDAFRSFAESHR